MTARNPYAQRPPDFVALAAAHPAFKPHVIPNPQHTGSFTIDWKDPDACTALNEALLQVDFGITTDQPRNRLCPPIPNRFNYLLWIQDLHHATLSARDGEQLWVDETDVAIKEDLPRASKRARLDGESASSTPARPRTLDIGTGATAIYPVLGCLISPTWTFVGTDIDTESLQSARKTVDDPQNNTSEHLRGARCSHQTPLKLADRITLLQRSSADKLIPTDKDIDAQCAPLFASSMCNPPFYASAEEMQASLAAKSKPPHAACSGAEVEMITDQGEVGFVGRILEESLECREEVVWYTSMLGKLSSVEQLLSRLRRDGIDNVAMTELLQAKTKRWAIAWSFTAHRLPDDVNGYEAMKTNKHLLQLLPPPTMIEIVANGIKDEIRNTIRSIVENLPGATNIPKTAEKEEILFLRFERNSWNRAARRQAKQQTVEADQVEEPLLCLLLTIKDQPPVSAGTTQTEGDVSSIVVRLQWTYGRSRKDFESFGGMLSRKLTGKAI